MIRRPVINLQKHVVPAFLALSSVALAGASCGNKSNAEPEDNPENVVQAYDEAHGGAGGDTGSTEPIPGADLSALDDSDEKTFHNLANSLVSPCGDAQSLRASAQPDAGCKRAPFAAKYVAALLADGFTEDEVVEAYNARYKDIEEHSFELSDRPHLGPPDARVELVEFFDFGCPACKKFGPVLKEAVVPYAESGKAVLVYKQFPLPSHQDSDEAAQAALAAAKQGKYHEMHELLFANQHRHKKSDLERYAKSIGLDMDQFQKDYDAAKETVKADIADGDQANVRFTPTLFINGRKWEGPGAPEYIRMWIEEELAVNR